MQGILQKKTNKILRKRAAIRKAAFFSASPEPWRTTLDKLPKAPYYIITQYDIMKDTITMTELVKRNDCTCFNVKKVTRLRELAGTADFSERSKAFKAVGHPRRLLTLYLIGEGQLCVCDLAHTLEAPVSTVSQYLRILKDADLIYDVQEHKFLIYHLTELGRELMGGLTND